MSPPAGAHTHEPNCDPNPRGPTEYDAGAHLAKREGGGSHVVRVRVHANPWYGVVVKKIKLNFLKKMIEIASRGSLELAMWLVC